MNALAHVNTAAREAAAMIAEWREQNPERYAFARVQHNRWQAAHGTRLALADWLAERQAGIT